MSTPKTVTVAVAWTVKVPGVVELITTSHSPLPSVPASQSLVFTVPGAPPGKVITGTMPEAGVVIPATVLVTVTVKVWGSPTALTSSATMVMSAAQISNSSPPTSFRSDVMEVEERLVKMKVLKQTALMPKALRSTPTSMKSRGARRSMPAVSPSPWPAASRHWGLLVSPVLSQTGMFQGGASMSCPTLLVSSWALTSLGSAPAGRQSEVAFTKEPWGVWVGSPESHWKALKFTWWLPFTFSTFAEIRRSPSVRLKSRMKVPSMPGGFTSEGKPVGAVWSNSKPQWASPSLSARLPAMNRNGSSNTPSLSAHESPSLKYA